MKHLGDITKIHGYEIEPVDVITGGSPCQDLSVAGLRKSLQGERSGLFFEQIRIIKEMRDATANDDRRLVKPRFCIWENVTGAYSSSGKDPETGEKLPKGSDFQQVLTEFIKIVEPEAPDVPLPAKGWPRAGLLTDVDGRWSLAWRTHNAEYWGTPQRRERICVLADLNGPDAGKLLFETECVRPSDHTESHDPVRHPGRREGCAEEVLPVGKSLPGHHQTGRAASQDSAGDTEESSD